MQFGVQPRRCRSRDGTGILTARTRTWRAVPVTGSEVTLYQTANSGYAAASTSIASTKTDSSGNWSLNGFSCTSGTQLYLVATGGNPGLSTAGGPVNNAKLALTAVVGTCGGTYLASSFNINEVTTVATEYALAGFATDSLHIGSSSTNSVGLTNAVATVGNLVNLTTGQALSTTPAYATQPANTSADTFRSIVPTDLINTLADLVAGCVNTDGTGSACSNLLTLAGARAIPRTRCCTSLTIRAMRA